MTTKTETKKEVAISKVVVQLGRRELILDIEEAKQLKNVLNELFGQVIVEKTEVVKEHHYHNNYPYFYNYPPVTYYGNYSTGGLNGAIYCSTVTNSTMPAQFKLNIDDKGEAK